MTIGYATTKEPKFFFNGNIDDVRFYARALAPDEVRSLRQPKVSWPRNFPVKTCLHFTRFSLCSQETQPNGRIWSR